MPLCFRAPGVALRVEDALERARPKRGARKLVAEGRLRFARTSGLARPWQPGAPLGDLRSALPPGAALWLDDESDAPQPAAPDAERELELPALPWPAGRVPLRGGASFRFEVVGAPAADRARVRFTCEGDAAQGLLGWAAAAGSPVVMDLRRGGSIAREGEPLFAPQGALRISAAAQRALARGHPWLTRDRESEDEGRFAPGAIVALRGADGAACGLARIEGGPQLVARRWDAPDPDRAQRARGKPASIEERALRALARREKLLASGESDALRLVHGEADGLPGLFADRFGPLLRVLVAGRAALPLWERASAALANALHARLGEEPSVVLVMQLKPQPPGELLCVRHRAGPPPEEPFVVHEGALAFRIDPGLAEPTRPHPGVGLFPDQRANRARLAQRVRAGGAYLNLFAHTGAFSAALLAAGAGSVTSVDLSAPYLARLEENLVLSDLPAARHRTVKRDVRRFLRELASDAQFDGIVLDPPTAASAGREFWSARTGLEELVALSLAHLATGGFLLVSSNDRRARGRLRGHVEAAAQRAGVVVRLGSAPPSADFPPLRGFPEGDAFEAVIAQCERKERPSQH
jgi:23S rRNA (cytosine1962-C5)-methyltransferase